MKMQIGAFLLLVPLMGLFAQANPLYFQTYDQIKLAQKHHDQIVQSTYRQMLVLQNELDQHHEGPEKKCASVLQRWILPAHVCDQWLVDEADFEARLKVAERRFVDSKMYLRYLEIIDNELSHDLANAQISSVSGHLDQKHFELLGQLASQQQDYRKWNESYAQKFSIAAGSSWMKSFRRSLENHANIDSLGLSDVQLKLAYTLLRRDQYLESLRQANDILLFKFAKPVESFQKVIMDFQQAICQQADFIAEGPSYLKMTGELDHYLRTRLAPRSANPDCIPRPSRQIPGTVP